MTPKQNANDAFLRWYDHLQLYSGFPAKGTIAGALVVLEHLQNDFDLSIESHTARGGSQVRGASGSAVKAIWNRLVKQGRSYAKEADKSRIAW